MAQILTYDQINRQQWSKLVRTSETGTWFQSPEAYDFYASLPELMQPFVYAVVKDEKLCAVCVGYVTKEPNAIKQFFTRRAIIIGGVVIAKDCAKEDIVELLSYIRIDLEQKSIYIETRNFNDFSYWKEAFETAGFAYKPHLNFHVDPSVNNLSDNRKRQLKKSDATTELAGDSGVVQGACGTISYESKNTTLADRIFLGSLSSRNSKIPISQARRANHRR